MTRKFLSVGGLFAAGFDASGQFLLTVSHSGLGVFSTRSWERVARSNEIAYPEAGAVLGIGPLQGQTISVTELDYQTERLQLKSPDGSVTVNYQDGTVEVVATSV